MQRLSIVVFLVCALLNGCEKESVSFEHDVPFWNTHGPVHLGARGQAMVPDREVQTASDACMGVDQDGLCFGQLLTQCVASQLVAVDCVASCGGICISHPKNDLPACLCGAGEDPCFGVPETGECQGDVLLKCIDGYLTGIDCASYETSCVTGSEGVGCGTSGVVDECGSVTLAGQCDDGILSWCNNGTLEVQDCVEEGKQCALEPVLAAFGCF
jgi:hypothetical protein